MMWKAMATVAGLSFQAALSSMDILQTLVKKVTRSHQPFQTPTLLARLESGLDGQVAA